MEAEAFAKLKAKERVAYAAFKAAEKAWLSLNKKVRKEVEERQSKLTSIPDLLQTHIGQEDGVRVENSRGYKALEDLTNGELKDSGLGFWGSYFPATDQWQMRVIINRDRSDEALKETAKIVRKWTKYLKRGALANYNYGKPVEPTERDSWKAFYVFTHDLNENGIVYLCEKEDGSWTVAMLAYYRWTYVDQKSLLDALKFIRLHHWYGSEND